MVHLAWRGIAELGHFEDGHRPLSQPRRVLSSETRPLGPPSTQPPFALSWRVSPESCGLWSRRRNTMHSLLRGQCLAATRLARKHNTIRAPAQQSPPRQRLVRQGVSDSGCTTAAMVPRIGPFGSAPQKMSLACTIGPFREVAPRIFPCRKADQPKAGERYRPEVSEPTRSRVAAFRAHTTASIDLC